MAKLGRWKKESAPLRKSTKFFGCNVTLLRRLEPTGETMTSEQMHVMNLCARRMLAGEMTLLQVINRLGSVGVERYHVDYSRREFTFYLSDGDSHVIAAPHSLYPTATEFVPSAIEAAVRKSHICEETYVDFVRQTMAAGCVGYFVQITGKRAIYFGRDGDCHIEHFPFLAATRRT